MLKCCINFFYFLGMWQEGPPKATCSGRTAGGNAATDELNISEKT